MTEAQYITMMAGFVVTNAVIIIGAVSYNRRLKAWGDEARAKAEELRARIEVDNRITRLER